MGTAKNSDSRHVLQMRRADEAAGRYPPYGMRQHQAEGATLSALLYDMSCVTRHE